MSDTPITGLEAQAVPDAERDAVVTTLRQMDPDGTRMARALRLTIDMLLDGQHTGRYRWDQLLKTEKTHCGTLAEINLQREFGFVDGVTLDYSIAGFDVDCKYSQTLGGWMIPPEAVGHLLLVIWTSDAEGVWCAGVIRARERWLRPSSNRDMKRHLNETGRAAIKWLAHRAPLPENVLLRLPDEDVTAIFEKRSGQQRLNELFRRAQGRRITRNIVATVAQQDDYMKRARSNGGSRTQLRSEGIVILGDYASHVEAALALALPPPGPGEFVSARLARRQDYHTNLPSVILEDTEWVVALPHDPPEIAPELPETHKKK